MGAFVGHTQEHGCLGADLREEDLFPWGSCGASVKSVTICSFIFLNV